MKKSKKLLLLGAISPFCDLVREIEAEGMIPCVSDYYPDAPAKFMGFPSFDVSTTDVDEVTKLALAEKVDGCVAAFSDRNILPCADVCDRIGSQYFFDREIIGCLTDKLKMKACFSSIGVPVTKYDIVSYGEIDKTLLSYNFPVVIKPIDSYGSKGIFVCGSAEEVKSLYLNVTGQSLNYTDKIIIEEFYAADEISVSAWVHKGETFITCVYDVFRNIDADITLSGVSFPSKYSDRAEELRRLTGYIVKKLNITEGPVTLQCFIGENGLKVSELLCRLAGGSPYLYSIFLGGPNLARMLIQKSAGEPINYQNLMTFEHPPVTDEVFYDILVLVNKKGRMVYSFDENSLRDSIPELVDCRIYYRNGFELKNVSSSGVHFAKVFCKTSRSADYLELIKRIESVIKVVNENGDRISFIRKPKRMDVVSCFDFDTEDCHA